MDKDWPEIRTEMELMKQSITDNCQKLDECGKKKARASADYDLKIAITMIGLREGENYTVGTKTIREPPPVTIIEKLARGICSEERFAVDVAEAGYKACITKIEAAKSILNANQSIWRHSE